MTHTKMNTRDLLLAWLSLLTSVLPAAEPTQPPELDFQETYGGEGEDGLVALVPTRDGGLFVVGNSQSKPSGNRTAPLMGGYSDFWVVKVDEYGNKMWDRSYGESGALTYAIMSGAVETPEGGVFMVGSKYIDAKRLAWGIKD